MSTTTPAEHDRTREVVIDWRRHELRRAGYDRKQAAKLAAKLDVDLHQAVDLVQQGCAPATAVAILL
jgi:hypothetical protein